MNPSFVYIHQYLSDEFENYIKLHKSQSDELAAFFEGFLLAASDSSRTYQDADVLKLIHYYRHFGYLEAHFNPLEAPSASSYLKSSIPENSLVNAWGLFKEEKVSFKDLQNKLKAIYSSSVGYEFLHCSKEIMNFIIDFLEKKEKKESSFHGLGVFKLIAQAEIFETFLHTRFPGQKRFSLEGLETSIVLIEQMLQMCIQKGYKNAYFGMAHRGRLNLLANIFQKPLKDIFKEFSKENGPTHETSLGDVKYHQGTRCVTQEGLELVLSSNPSHLEAVDPVVLGMAYAKNQITGQKTLPFMIHGDASFAGQGIVYETMQMSKIKNYDAGGVIHLILNNQIGFTAIPSESRSTPYATDLAKSFNCPIFHVNSEDVEALKNVAELAIELVSRFGCDIMIDLVGYRKWGHNESDEPTFTQPHLYARLKDKKSPLTLYKEWLLQKSPELAPQIQKITAEIEESLKKHLLDSDLELPLNPKDKKSNFSKIDLKNLQLMGETITTLPQSFSVHPKLKKLYQERFSIIKEKKAVDFALAELLALGACVDAGKNLRFVGQDSARGTFSQRHAVLIDQANESRYLIFQPLVKKDKFASVINSFLSEYAALGFEYGFSKIAQDSLTLWEAQFGDFANGAQIIIDQFIAAGKTKWSDESNLTLLLPHGYEGQGPEHSSARIERFLELCGENNMKVAIPSTPKQYFHLLVDQVHQKIPLVIFTPKALLRNPLCKSPFDELSSSAFETLIDDGNQKAKVLVLCYGKIYFDLKKIQDEKNLDHISVVRVEQLYPLDVEKLEQIKSQKKELQKIVLVQDEPLNMGAYTYLKAQLETLAVISRKQASSPATGFYQLHEKQYQDILTQFENL